MTRYRIDLVRIRTAEKQRVEKLLEDARIKLSVVASDIFGVSGRDMMAALIAGERDPKALAQLARTSMRRKISVLEEAFTGHFTDHHAFLLAKMLARVDAIDADIAGLDAEIEEMTAPFASAVARLDEIPGIGRVAAAVIIAEIGRHDPLPHRRPPGLLGEIRPRGQGIRWQEERQAAPPATATAYLARVLGEAAVAAAKTDTFLGERYRRIARRRGPRRPSSRSAAPSWSSSGTCCPIPKPATPTSAPASTTPRINPEPQARNHVRQLEALGYKVTLEPAA